jgi:zinc finger FYVE domain-containing protein 26
MAAIRVFVEQHKDVKTAENLIGKVVSVKSKVYAYVLCRKLKAAYLLAVKANDIGLIELILDEARKQNDKTVQELCEKYLANGRTASLAE